MSQPGDPLTQKVAEYSRVMRDLVPRVRAPADWGPLAELVAVDTFERIGVFMEVQDWPQYVAMLTAWAGSVDSFETTERRVTEARDLVFYEIEERHQRGGGVHTVHSMTVFTFDEDRKISRLDVYLQQHSMG